MATGNNTFWTSNVLAFQLFSISSSISSLNASAQLGCLQQCTTAATCWGVAINSTWCSGLTDLGPSQLKPTNTPYSLYVKLPAQFDVAGTTYSSTIAQSVCGDSNCTTCGYDDPTVRCRTCAAPLLPFGRTCVSSCPFGQLAQTYSSQLSCLHADDVYTIPTSLPTLATNFLSSYLIGNGLSLAVSAPLSLNARFVCDLNINSLHAAVHSFSWARSRARAPSCLP